MNRSKKSPIALAVLFVAALSMPALFAVDLAAPAVAPKAPAAPAVAPRLQRPAPRLPIQPAQPVAAADPVAQHPDWKLVDEAVNKGLPKTAIERLEPIIARTMKEKRYAEAIRAIGKKIALEGNIQGNKPEEKITRLQAEIAKAPKEMVPVMDAILANWYWHFFQQNRWRFMQRTQSGQANGKDLLTWDLQRIFTEIDAQFTKALSAADVLKKTPVADYNDLIQKATAPDSYRPTMYDFLAHNALAFYMSPEQAGTKASDAFELAATGPILDDTAAFLAWKPATTDTTSRTLQAVRLYQDLIRFHKDDAKPDALADADLWRLDMGQNLAVGETKNARYKAAMKRFVDRWADHPLSTRALHKWASVLHGEGEWAEAHALAKRGAEVFPDSDGGIHCFNLKQQIEQKNSQVSVERVWNDPQPQVHVRYRNLTEIHFRIVAENYDELIKRHPWQPEALNDNERKALLGKEIIKEWSIQLTPTDDYQERLQKVEVPKGVKPGFYFLISSHDKNFGGANNMVYFTDFWASDLAFVIRTHQGDGVVSGFLLNAITGEPIANGDIRAWQRVGQNRVEVPAQKTDANGQFKFAANNTGYLLLASANGQRLSTSREHYNGMHGFNQNSYQHTVFFTDRSLYRPGQTIEYKGICINVDPNNDNYTTVPNAFLTVVFNDPNGKEVTRQNQRANEYGSFSGKFTAPRDRLMGRMSMHVINGPNGSAAVSVEEYKRPKFQVELEAPKTAAKLGAAVKLTGKATGYTGAAINDAQVKWRVVRQVRYPMWWGWYYWWRPAAPNNSQEIAHGTAVTKVDGGFDIEFTAMPDLTVPEKDEPTFHYQIHADVTDTTGETRSNDRNINVGYTALAATLSAGDWQTSDQAVVVSINTASLDGIGQAAEGSLKIHRLKEPATVQRASLVDRHHYPMPVGKRALTFQPEPDASQPNSWELGAAAATHGFTTDKDGKASFSAKLPVGAYRAVLETQDRFGKKVTAQLPFMVVDPKAPKLAIKIPNLLASPKWSVEPGEDFTAYWGSGYGSARAFVEVEHRHKVLQSYWTEQGLTQLAIKQAVNEAMRGGFTLHITMVRENRAYLSSHRVNVPWSNKELSVKWEHFVNKLQPSQKETWTAVVTGPNAKKAVAEMVATLYDESLDQYLRHQWQTAFGVFRQDYARLGQSFENMNKGLQYLQGQWPQLYKGSNFAYRQFPNEIAANLWGYEYFDYNRKARFGGGGGMGGPPMAMMARAATAPGGFAEQQSAMQADGALMEAAAKSDRRANFAGEDKQANGQGGRDEGAAGAANKGPDLGQVTARKNLNEQAFFLPHLLSDKDGVVKMEFTMPEALTKWKFMAFAHDNALRSGYLTDSAVTAKDLMVQPNAPRFLREGDKLEFTVKVSNLTDKVQKGQVRLTLNDAVGDTSVDALLGNVAKDLAFDVPAKQSRTYSWRLNVPDNIGYLSYKAVGATDKMSDGEAGFLPVLSRRIFVTESLPLPIRGARTKKFDFAKLAGSGKSDTIKHERFTVQMVSNPTWYAVMALPYLMETPFESTEATFNRLYANSLARHIAKSDARIRGVFDQWRDTPALDSPLEKNQDLKAVMLEETPWLRQAKNESQARRNVGILFDDGRLTREVDAMLRKLRELQRPDGAWSWFPGGPPNDYMTLYIATGFGRLRNLGVDVDISMALNALNRMDGWVDEQYRWILRHGDKTKNNLSHTIAFYLYGRSFFIKERPIAAQHKEAFDYYVEQGKKHWLSLANRQSQAHLAIGLHRVGDAVTPKGIVASLKERSVTNEEMGTFWRDTEYSWWWYRAPIESQAVMIEAFHEIAKDFNMVEDCKVWLLKQKQTQDWKTTKATADACYALLLQGANWLASDALVEVSLGEQNPTKIVPKKVEAGTGFYEQRYLGTDVKPDFGKITVTKHDEGVSWGSVHWQYMEDISKVTAHTDTPLKLEKQLFTRVNTAKGPQLVPVAGNVTVGSEMIVRIVLRTDRDMEYVHMKDQRGSGTEPVNVLSRYKYQDGIGYYESTRDTASHFFVDYLPKGTYVFEYAVRVQHKGQYQTGMASIQCLYAPEFNSHSQSHMLSVN